MQVFTPQYRLRLRLGRKSPTTASLLYTVLLEYSAEKKQKHSDPISTIKTRVPNYSLAPMDAIGCCAGVAGVIIFGTLVITPLLLGVFCIKKGD